MHEESLIVIKPGSQRVVYDGRFAATLINDLNAQTGTYDDAEKWALAGQYSTYFTGTISNTVKCQLDTHFFLSFFFINKEVFLSGI